MNIAIVESRLRRDNALPADFQFFHWEMMPHGAKLIYCELEGGVCPRFKSGPRKGKWNYKQATGVRKFYVTMLQAEVWEREWVAETGLCAACTGTGRRIKRWSKNTGAEYKTCPVCKGTCKAVVLQDGGGGDVERATESPQAQHGPTVPAPGTVAAGTLLCGQLLQAGPEAGRTGTGGMAGEQTGVDGHGMAVDRRQVALFEV